MSNHLEQILCTPERGRHVFSLVGLFHVIEQHLSRLTQPSLLTLVLKGRPGAVQRGAGLAQLMVGAGILEPSGNFRLLPHQFRVPAGLFRHHGTIIL